MNSSRDPVSHHNAEALLHRGESQYLRVPLHRSLPGVLRPPASRPADRLEPSPGFHGGAGGGQRPGTLERPPHHRREGTLQAGAVAQGRPKLLLDYWFLRVKSFGRQRMFLQPLSLQSAVFPAVVMHVN